MMRRLLVLVPMIALGFGCASTPELPPKAGPEEVTLYDPNVGQYPEEGYETIGPIEVERPLGTPVPELVMALRAEAAQLGADGVILQRIRQSTEGSMASDLSREEFIIARGLAIYYPAPEEPGATEQSGTPQQR